jgi:hypothetical protein
MNIPQGAEAVKTIARLYLRADEGSGLVKAGRIREAVTEAVNTYAAFHETITAEQAEMIARDLESTITTYVSYTS